ncbi:LutC/YkgG family protein [Macrococcus carouselicus]|uniref:Lactate utilization protein C n=1 Tax=Macrococcus carouselicus TaxID=69969 RepID=A0A9Q8CID6_9STAP|nr:lactate utilization protein C [Macrococcus carouselicus]TDM00905.1 lactate utilization protein C [Macrococcus carouselicus]
MTGKIYNKDRFLKNITQHLNRPVPSSVTKPDWHFRPQDKTLSGLSQDELVEVMKQHSVNIHTDVVQTTAADLNTALAQVVENYGGGEVIAWNDSRFDELGIDLKRFDTFIWDEAKGAENIEVAERANIGITFSDATLAESATVVLYADKGKGRSVSLLPAAYVAIIPKSTIVPRFTQAAEQMNLMNQDADFPTCINMITGPSNSADIEMKLVVGVHGPIKATYIIVEDY